MAKKLFYSMGEVSEMFDVNASLIRFWETKFDILRPQKNEALTLDPVNPNAETGYVLLSLQGGLVG